MNKKTEKFDVRESVFFPETISRKTIQNLKLMQKNQGSEIMSGFRNVDKVMTPFRGNELIPVLGFTSNYKSGLMRAFAHNAKDQLTDPNEIIVICNWEESIEDMGIWDIASMARMDTTKLDRGEYSDSEWKKLIDESVKRAEVPIYYIGYSETTRLRRVRLNLSQVWEILLHLKNYHGKIPRLIILDYLQRIPPVRFRGDFRIGMMENVDISKDMSIGFGCPVMLGTQASRKTRDLKNPKMPMLEHAQETSNIEQSASKFFSVCIPSKTMDIDERFTYANQEFVVNKNLLLVALLKQKRGIAPVYFAFHIDFESHKLTPVDRKHVS